MNLYSGRLPPWCSAPVEEDSATPNEAAQFFRAVCLLGSLNRYFFFRRFFCCLSFIDGLFCCSQWLANDLECELWRQEEERQYLMDCE